MFAEKNVLMYNTHVKRLHSVKRRYSDDAGAIIENVYKFCMKEKVWNETVTESCMGQDCSTHRR